MKKQFDGILTKALRNTPVIDPHESTRELLAEMRKKIAEKAIEAELHQLLQRATFTKTDPIGNQVSFIYLEVGSPNWKKFQEIIGTIL